MNQHDRLERRQTQPSGAERAPSKSRDEGLPWTGWFLLLFAITICSFSPSRAADESSSTANREPLAWGLLTHSKGCVIFREYRKTKIGFWVVAVTAKSHGELEVIEALDYPMDQKVWIESDENMNELQRRAVRDSIRYVKLQDKYTPEELEAARALCIKDSVMNP